MKTNTITAAMLDSMTATTSPRREILVTLTGPDGTPYRTRYGANLLDSLRAEARVQEIADAETGEILYSRAADAPTQEAATETEPVPATRAELFDAHADDIQQAMLDAYRRVIDADGMIQISIYIWSDGELETCEAPQGDHSWLAPRYMEPRSLYRVTTIDAGPCFDIWDYSADGRPEDDDEADAAREEIADAMLDSYRDALPDMWGVIMDSAEDMDAYDAARG